MNTDMSEHKRKERTIFWMALRSLLAVLAVEMLLMADSMVQNWSNLSVITDKVNACTQEHLGVTGMTPEDLGREGGASH